MYAQPFCICWPPVRHEMHTIYKYIKFYRFVVRDVSAKLMLQVLSTDRQPNTLPTVAGSSLIPAVKEAQTLPNTTFEFGICNCVVADLYAKS